MKKIAVAVSGGVDSAAALFLLKEKGYETVAFYADYFDCIKDSPSASCCAGEGPARARATALFLEVPFYRLDLRKEFTRLVKKPFTQTYNRGLTPNPCIWCNEHLRFGLMLEKIKAMGIDFMATGHYAAVKGDRLFRAAYKPKDQSYFLYSVKRENLKRVIFPLARLNKREVRKIAQSCNLPAAKAPESQDSCILSEESLAQYMGNSLRPIEGNVTDERGRVLGKHRGFQNYTVGQGLGLGGMKKKLYVSAIIPGENRIIAAGKVELYKERLRFKFKKDIFFAGAGETLKAKLRSTQKAAECLVEKLDFKQNICKIRFKKPVWAPAPGQSAVLYREDEVVGGGEILN